MECDKQWQAKNPGDNRNQDNPGPEHPPFCPPKAKPAHNPDKQSDPAKPDKIERAVDAYGPKYPGQNKPTCRTAR